MKIIISENQEMDVKNKFIFRDISILMIVVNIYKNNIFNILDILDIRY